MREQQPLGRLKPVDLREVWASEADGFTPWLAVPENVSLLGETIGMDLEIESCEREVGPFRADILCKETTTEDWVLIENQLERTDHTHLGQLLTYAAGLKAVTIVWVARKFAEEHRAALDWLNEITGERFRFFGLEVEAWRIGDSLPAPKFNIVSKPNDWSRTIADQAARASGSELSGMRRLRADFWNGFCAYAAKHAKRIQVRGPRRADVWLSIPIGRSGFSLSAVASTFDSETETYGQHELRAELLIRMPEAHQCFERFQMERTQIDQEMGEPLQWFGAEGRQQRTIYVRRQVDLNDRAAWPEYFEWLTDRLDRLHAVFQPRVKALDLDSLGLS